MPVIPPVIPREEMTRARTSALADIKTVVTQAARRATKPAFRSAFAEMEQEIANLEARWREGGLIPTDT